MLLGEQILNGRTGHHYPPTDDGPALVSIPAEQVVVSLVLTICSYFASRDTFDGSTFHVFF